MSRKSASRLVLAAMVLLAAASAPAQSQILTAALPSAPNPAPTSAPAPIRPATSDDDLAQRGSERSASLLALRQPAQEADPVVTMFPHAEGARWWISGQANLIFQGRLPFHSAYQGPNSFLNSAEYKFSQVGTLYTAFRPTRSVRYNTDLIFDLEAAEGRGLSQALGLAGYTNLDVVRNPYLGKKPYIARYEIHQVIGLTGETASQDGNFFALATEVPARRLEFRVGKLTMPDFFDVNDIGSDSHLQFMNWTIDNNGAWDYAADTRGYTVGGMAEYDDRSWSFRYGIFAMPTVANGIDMDWAFSRAHGQNTEFELRRGVLRNRKGTQRILYYANRAHMGDYREAVQAFLNGTDPTPIITNHEHFGALKYGVGYNTQQEITDNFRVFARFGWNDGKTESYAYTEVEQTVLMGGDYFLKRWHRPDDKLGLAFVTNAIKRDHQNYLHYGGLGFLLGDGNLNYGRENIVESYYTWHAWRGMFYSADVQHIQNPGYNRDRGPAWVGSARMHVDF